MICGSEHGELDSLPAHNPSLRLHSLTYVGQMDTTEVVSANITGYIEVETIECNLYPKAF